MKFLYTLCISIFFWNISNYSLFAQGSEIVNYYQTINLDDTTACNCNNKSDRNAALNTRLLESDVKLYDMHAYKYVFKESMLPTSKLVYAFEEDKNVYKGSFSMETNTFMILTTPKFDLQSFEGAAKIAFKEIYSINPQDFLIKKNKSCYDEYMKFLEKQAQSKSPQ